MVDIEKLYADNFDPVYRYTLSICNDSDSAQEITQQTMVKAIENILKIRVNGIHPLS